MAPTNPSGSTEVQWVTADEAARRLGIKLATLYSYVSRGVVRSHPMPEGKGSRFDRAELESVLHRRRSQPAGSADPVVASRITRLHESGVRYRGHLAHELAQTHTYEEVAALLWDVPHAADGWRPATLPRTALGREVALSDRLRVAVAVAATLDDHRTDRRRESVVVSARSMISTAVAALPITTSEAPTTLAVAGRRVRNTIAASLAARLGAARVSASTVKTVNAALILLADHEMATSTLAARAAASTRSDPYLTVLAGLACGGPLHAGASRDVGQLLDDAERRGVAVAVGDLLRAGRPLPGFGHKVYRHDPRFTVLWDMLQASGLSSSRIEVAAAVREFAAERIPVEPNVDFGGASFTFAAGMRIDAFETIFLVARMAGWIAHTLEEYDEAPVRFRTRSLFVTSEPLDGALD